MIHDDSVSHDDLADHDNPVGHDDPVGHDETTADRLALDRRARELAQTRFERPLVLEAGAGTGKTATLVNRVLAWSLGPGWTAAATRLTDTPQDLDAPDVDPARRIAAAVLRRVVAITFTEAAAAEMAERVVAALGTLRDGHRPVGFLPHDPVLAERAGHLLGVADQLQVRTIHGFCRRLLVSHPFEAGIHPHFSVDAEGSRVRDLAEEIVRDALPRAYGDPGDEACLRLAGLGVGPAELAEAVIALVQAGLAAEDLDVDPLEPARGEALTRRYATALAETLNVLERRLTGARRAKNARRLADGLRQILVRIEALPTDGRADQRGDVSESPLAVMAHVTQDALPPPLRQHLAGWRRGRFNATERDHLATDASALRRAAERLAPLVDHALRQDPARLDAGRRALAPLLATVRRRMHVEGVLVFDDLLRRAARLLREQPAVAQRTRAGMDQLLVDEFQDTDARQCALIRSLTLEGPADQRPGLFVVGDPKQSIYGWRNADLAAYEAFVAALLDAGGDRLPLVENFRSVPAVLDEVTRLIAPVMKRQPGVQPPFEPLVPCAALRDQPGHTYADPTDGGQATVEHWLSWRADGDLPPARTTDGGTASAIEALAVVRDLRRLRALDTPWRDVGLLVRATTDIDVYLGALREAGIPFVVSHDRQYYRRREIVEATASVRAILAPDDELALLAFLRSASVGIPDAALLPLWRYGLPAFVRDVPAPAGDDDDDQDVRHQDVHHAVEAIIDQAVAATPSGPGLDALADWPVSLRYAIDTLRHLRHAFVHEPTDVFLTALRRRLRQETTEAARYLGPYRLANLVRFFTELHDDLETHAGNRHAVLRALRLRGAGGVDRDEAPPPEAEGDAVQVMTIHRAKGLQFPHVYLLQTHKQARPPGLPLIDVERHGKNLEYTLFGAPSPAWDAVLARRDAVGAAELVRTLYVASTRAARRLVLVGCRDLEPVTDTDHPGDGGPAPTTHGQLLDQRDGRGPGVATLLDHAAAGQAVTVGDDGVLWRVPAAETALADDPLALPEDPMTEPARDLEPVVRRLAAWRAAAAARMDRPFGAAASGLGALEKAASAMEDRGPANDDSERDPERDPKRRIAMAAGTLVHLAFEHVDLSSPTRRLEDAVEDLAPLLDRALDALAQGDEANAARTRARAVLATFLAGPLRDRFDHLRPTIVARELPLVAPPATEDGHAGSPIAFVAGTIDMVYLDPERGPVIVDYKTDPVADGTTDDVLTARYRAQASLYAHALHAALDLPRIPPVELWYLAAGRVVEPAVRP